MSQTVKEKIMQLSEQNIEASINYLNKQIKKAKSEINEKEKFIAYLEGGLAVWNQIKQENARTQAEIEETSGGE